MVFVAVLLPAATLLARPVLSIAHRGGALYAPENTIAAFTNSLSVADLMETDAQITSDGKFVIMHDLTVDRTTDGVGAVASQTLAQLQLLDAGAWFGPQFVAQRIPTMEQMIAVTLPGAVPFIEAKAGGAAAYVAEFRRLNVVTNVIFQSFDWNFLSQVHVLEPNLKLCALGSGPLTATSLSSVTNAGARLVSWSAANVTSNELGLAHNMGLELYVWTVNSGAEITNFLNLGVDGIVSDDPWAVRGGPPPVNYSNNPPAAPTYLGDRVIAYWKMDDGLADDFATSLADSAGSNPATFLRADGLSHWVSGGQAKLGGGLQLAGTNAYVNVPANAAFNINTNALSLSMWVKLGQFPAQLATSFGSIYDSATDCYVVYLDKGNNELRFKITTGNSQAARPGIAAMFLRTNEWLHVAAVFDGNAGSAGQAAIYLNGALMDRHIGDDATPGNGLTGNVKSGQLASMGREGPTGGNGFVGVVDDLAIWKRALEPAEIQRIFNCGQLGQDLFGLMIQPTELVVITSVRQSLFGGQLEIEFQNLGTWSTFQLRRATTLSGPFFTVPNLQPTSLGSGNYRYSYLPASTVEFLRIEAQ